MPRPKARKLSKKETKALSKTREKGQFVLASKPPEKIEKSKKTIELPQVVPVRVFAELVGVSAVKVIETLFKNGVRATINESIDFDTAAIIADEFNAQLTQQTTNNRQQSTDNLKNAAPRPPIVAIMGHVDHGKTKLLDAIRQTNVIATESGGITQAIGAYQVSVKTKQGGRREITFLDTPGHEVFSTLRAHGANLTDIVVLVVAANDGVKPQTLEALSHARAANCPIIVAVNKIDLPEANIERVKTQLAEQGLIPEQWGGKTPIVEISAKQNLGIDHLLEIILLVCDLNPPYADPTASPSGAIVEAHLEAGAGPMATALVTQGILKIGDFIAAGKSFGKIRFMRDWQKNRVAQAKPSAPVVVAGLRTLPEFGDIFTVCDSESEARQMANSYFSRLLPVNAAAPVNQTADKTLNLIIKADATSSLEALTTTIKEMSTQKVDCKIIDSGVGPVSESDATLAGASRAHILAFRVPVSQTIAKLAQDQNVPIHLSSIIYQATDEIKQLLASLVEPKIVRQELGRLNVLEIFMQTANIVILGGVVKSGELAKNNAIYVTRGAAEVGGGRIDSLQIEKTATQLANKGQTCGCRIEKASQNNYKIKPSDTVVAYAVERIE